MELAEELLCISTGNCWQRKAALRQENAAANEQKAHARQIDKLQDEVAKRASMLKLFGPTQLRDISPDFFEAPIRAAC